MKISVVMSTYNGSRYIIEQMNSIMNQTRKADEVLIFDDASTDDTYSIVKEYIQEHSLNNWKIQRNPQNYGWRKSFMNAMSSASGDLIFLADQDDIWKSEKLEVMSKAFIDNPHMLVLAADYQSFKFNEIPINSEKKDKYVIEQVRCTEQWYYIRRPGCVLALKKELIPYMKDIWYEDYAHDALVWQLGLLFDGLYHIEYTAIYFRRHDTNATPPNKRDRKSRLLFINQTINDVQHVKKVFEKRKLKINSNFKFVCEFSDFVCHRLNLIQNRKYDEIFWLLSHKEFYFSPKSILVDIVCALKK